MGKNKCMVLGINNFGPTGINFENYHYFCILEWCVIALIKKYLSKT